MTQAGVLPRSSDVYHAVGQSAVYHGDSFLLLPRIRPETVRLILTDPPYNVTRANNLTTMGRRGIEFDWDGGFDQAAWLKLAAKALMPGGSIVVWNDWKNLGDLADTLSDIGFSVKRDLRWIKTNPFPRNRDRSFVQSGEVALWAVKNGGKWIFNRRVDHPYERGEFRYPVARDPIHPAKKPTGLFEELVEILSNPGDLVLDPFAGVGTTAVACHKLGRNHISFEKDKKFYDEAVKRWSALTVDE